MILTLSELKKMHDLAYRGNQRTREKGSDDLVFYWITQWDDQLLEGSDLQYRGEFNIIRRGGRDIMSSLRKMQVQPDFHPDDEAREDDAEILDGMYRADDHALSSQSAYWLTQQDVAVCGFGAWEMFTKYKTNRVGDERQVIRREWIPEANNTAFKDPDSVALDGSDAKYWSLLRSYTPEGYEELCKELTGEDCYGTSYASFAHPEESYTFPWTVEKRKIYVSTFYHTYKDTEKQVQMVDPFGETLILREKDVSDSMDELEAAGFQVEDERKVERWVVRKYIASGEAILNGEYNEETGEREGELIAGPNIPVIPMYGEFAIIEGEQHYEGLTRLTKDAQRLRNFNLSYVADIVGRSPRNKPVWLAEQLQGLEFMHEAGGSENNYPYLLQNRVDANGNELPLGPVGNSGDQNIPSALAASIELTRQAVEDVSSPGTPVDVSDVDLSGKAVALLEAKINKQFYVYQDHYKFSKRRDAEIYAGMASEIYDMPRKVNIRSPDGNTQQVEMMQAIIDPETGEPKYINDLTNIAWDVYATIGQTYEDQKEQSKENILKMLEMTPEGDPMRRALQLTLVKLTDGVEMDPVRKLARRELVTMGIEEAETDEEKAMLAAQQQAQNQPPPPDPAMLMAEAEQMKGQAAIMREQRQAQKDQADVTLKQNANDIDAYEAETNRFEAETRAATEQVRTQIKAVEQYGKRVDTTARARFGARLRQ